MHNYPKPEEQPWYIGVFVIIFLALIGIMVVGINAVRDIPPQERTPVQPIEAQGTEWTADNFRKEGILYYNGIRYTWHSEKILPELNSNGRSVSVEGYIIDKDRFIVCASEDYPIGTELWTPLGNVKVYNTECASGTIDIYTSW